MFFNSSILKQLALLCFAFALHCAGHFVVKESNQDPYKSGTLMLGTLNPGNLESENPSNLEIWTGTLELPKSATL